MAKGKKFNAAEGLYGIAPMEKKSDLSEYEYDESNLPLDVKEARSIGEDEYMQEEIRPVAKVQSSVAANALFESHVFQHRERKTVQKTFKFTESVAKQLKEGAARYDVSEAEYISALIRQGVVE